MNRKQRRAAPKRDQPSRARTTGSAADKAADFFERALQHHERGELGAAVHAYKKVLSLKPDDAAACDRLGLAYLAQGNLGKASAQVAALAALAPQTLDAFGEVIATLKSVSPPLASALADKGAVPALDGIAGDPFLQAVLASTVVRDAALERVLTALRAELLRAALRDPPAASADVLRFGSALAQQCFINEYAFAVGDDESADVERLTVLVEDALTRRAAVHPLRLLALAMYAPLHRLAGAAKLMEQYGAAKPGADVVRQQVQEPQTEHEIRAAIPRLTPIGDGVTAAVRQQYEENPYPRWVRLAPAPRPIVLDEHIRRQFPAALFRPTGQHDSLDILVAGCGTGRHALELAQTYRGARVLAVDLSLASLARAIRKTPPALASRVEFAQADILALSAIGRSFDLINAGGVLHHMGDPLAGWRELIELMRPDGLMQVGLYSVNGRRGILAARARIAARGYSAAAADIRRCRQALIREGDSVTQLNDFFSVSDCRDLLFHVHERQFTIPEIKAFLAEQNLKFIGFEFSPQDSHLHYRSVFSAAGWPLADLDRWDAFERANPDTFAGMYHLWVQKN